MNGNVFSMTRPAWRGTFQPPRSPAVARRVGIGSRQMLANPALGQNAGSALAGIWALALTGATAYVGIRAGLKDKGFPSILGWVVGVTSGLALAISLLEILVGAAVVRQATAPATTVPAPAPMNQEF